MKNHDIDEIVRVCQTWVEQHHRTSLTSTEANAIRTKLRERLHDRMLEKPGQFTLVELAHRLANSAVAQRRDQAQRAEHQRMARA